MNTNRPSEKLKFVFNFGPAQIGHDDFSKSYVQFLKLINSMSYTSKYVKFMSNLKMMIFIYKILYDVIIINT